MNFEDAIPIREYARINYCDDKIIRRHIESGRIPDKAVIKNEINGRPMIIPSIADEAWGKEYRERKGIKAEPTLVRKTKSRQVIQLPSKKNTTPVHPPDEVIEQISDNISNEDPEANEKDTLPDTNNLKTLTEADKACKIFDAKIKQLTYRKQKAELFEKDIVFKACFNFAREVRDTFLNLPDRVVHDMVATQDVNQAHQILAGAINDALEMLSRPLEIKQDV